MTGGDENFLFAVSISIQKFRFGASGRGRKARHAFGRTHQLGLRKHRYLLYGSHFDARKHHYLVGRSHFGARNGCWGLLGCCQCARRSCSGLLRCRQCARNGRSGLPRCCLRARKGCSGLLWRCQCPQNGHSRRLCFRQCAQKKMFEPASVPPVHSKRLFQERYSKMLVSVALCSEPLYSALLYSRMDMHGFTLYIATRSSVKLHQVDEPGH